MYQIKCLNAVRKGSRKRRKLSDNDEEVDHYEELKQDLNGIANHSVSESVEAVASSSCSNKMT